jgi:hypothetical protein
MAKVLEGPGMDLLKKWGIPVPNHVVLTSVDQFDPLAQANPWLRNNKLVVKAHEAFNPDGSLKDAKQHAAIEQLGAGLARVLAKLQD